MKARARRSGWRAAAGYWWILAVIIALALTGMAYLQPYLQVELSDLPPQVRKATAELDRQFGKPVEQSFQYAIRRSYNSQRRGSMEVEVRVTLRPLGEGLVQRQDDWYDLDGRTVVYQERYVLFRNLFTVHARTRETAPFVHDLMGRMGWYNDTAQNVNSKVEGGTPVSPGWKLTATLDRVSDTESRSLSLNTSVYQRSMACERSGETDGKFMGTGFGGTYPKVTCRIRTSDPPTERNSEYAYLPEHGIFLLLNYRQKEDNKQTMDVNGNYLSFKVQPQM